MCLEDPLNSCPAHTRSTSAHLLGPGRPTSCEYTPPPSGARFRLPAASRFLSAQHILFAEVGGDFSHAWAVASGRLIQAQIHDVLGCPWASLLLTSLGKSYAHLVTSSLHSLSQTSLTLSKALDAVKEG